MTNLIQKELSFKVVGVLYKVHQQVGRYAKERQYGDVLNEFFKKERIKFIREHPIKIADRKSNFVDFLINDCLLLDLKAKPFISKEDYYQMRRYLDAANIELGLIANFQQKYLKPKRVLNPNYILNSEHSDN